MLMYFYDTKIRPDEKGKEEKENPPGLNIFKSAWKFRTI